MVVKLVEPGTAYTNYIRLMIPDYEQNLLLVSLLVVEQFI